MATTDRTLDIRELDQHQITSTDFRLMQDYWRMVQAINGGAAAIRAEGEIYLPRFPEENAQSRTTDGRPYDPWEIRRKTAPFTNIYEDTSRNLAAKPFSRELMFKDETPDNYKALGENIDGQGNNLHVFCQEVFRDSIDYAITWVLVDYSRAPALDRPLNLAEERILGMRPIWQHIPWNRMLAVYSDFVAGEEIIVHARVHEPTIMAEVTPEGLASSSGNAPFLEKRVDRIRVMNRLATAWDSQNKPISYGPPTWQIWELVITPATANTQSTATWQIVDEGVFSVGIIPLVPFITGRRQGVSFVIDPPLRTLAYMQIDEYQQESNLQAIMQLTCFPMLAGDNVEQDTENANIAVGPRAVLYGGRSLDGRQGGTWKFVEPSGTSIQKVMDHLENTRTYMRDLGMQPMIQSNLTVITTGQVAVKANSAVQAWAIKFKDAVEQCLKITAAWLNDRNYEPEIDIFTDFAAITSDGTQMTTALAMRAAKDISRDGIIEAAKRFDVLPADFDPEENDLQLAIEQQGLQPEQQIDPATGQPIQQAVPGETPEDQPPVPPANGGGGAQPPNNRRQRGQPLQ